MRHFEVEQQAGRKSQPPGYRYESGDYDQLQVIYVTEGRLIFETGGQDTHLPPGGLVLLREHSAFSLRCERIGYQGIWYSDYTRSVPEFSGPAAAFIADTDMQSIAGLMQKEMLSPVPGSSDALISLGRSLTWLAVRRAREGKLESREDSIKFWADSACHAIDSAIYTGQGVREVLEPLGLSYRQLSRHFTLVTGMSPKDYQLKARIREAGRLLVATSLPITTIALELGYCSSQHFATQFQEVTGSSPREYRENERQAAAVETSGS